MLRKSNTKMRNLKGSIHAQTKSAKVASSMLEVFSKLDEIKQNKDLDTYGKKALAKKYLTKTKENIYANMGDVLGELQTQHTEAKKELFSSNRALSDADIVMLPVVYNQFQEGKVNYQNKNTAQMLLQLNAQGLVPDTVVKQVDSVQSPTVVEKIESINDETNRLGNIKQEFLNEVNSIFPEIDKFEEIA